MKVLLVFGFLALASCQLPSPCPEVLRYEPREENADRWHANITVKSSVDINGISLQIVLDEIADILLNWFGESTTSDNKNFQIKNENQVLQAGKDRNIKIAVKFNKTNNIPSVTNIRLNDEVICSSEMASPIAPFVSDDSNSNTISPIREEQAENNSSSLLRGRLQDEESRGEQVKQNTSSLVQDRIQDKEKPEIRGEQVQTNTSSLVRQAIKDEEKPEIRGEQVKTNTSSPVRQAIKNEEKPEIRGEQVKTNTSSLVRQTIKNEEKPEIRGEQVKTNTSSLVWERIQDEEKTKTRERELDKNICGTVPLKQRPLVFGKQQADKGRWPWHVALVIQEGEKIRYFCGGTLISANFVATAAHCVTIPSTKFLADVRKQLVYLGLNDFRDFGPAFQVDQVGDVIVHPEYDPAYFCNDIALLKLFRGVIITDYVRPICLWDGDFGIDRLIGNVGTVVGWTINSNSFASKVLNEAAMSVVPLDKCIYSDKKFFWLFILEKSYCAGYRYGTMAFVADSGNGMVFPKAGSSPDNPIWELRGLVSVSHRAPHYVVFTDVAKHVKWIKSTAKLE